MRFGTVKTYQCFGGGWCINFQNGNSNILEDETTTSTHPATKTSRQKHIIIIE